MKVAAAVPAESRLAREFKEAPPWPRYTLAVLWGTYSTLTVSNAKWSFGISATAHLQRKPLDCVPEAMK